MRKTRDKIKLRGSIVNEISTRGNFIKKIRDSLEINQNNQYLLEVVSLRDSQTAESIVVELNITKYNLSCASYYQSILENINVG